jgi:hypothetical protein
VLDEWLTQINAGGRRHGRDPQTPVAPYGVN